jgi:uncharacterized phage protein (TIGR01671 family)
METVKRLNKGENTMKREIEFRGKRAYNKEWVYGDLVWIPNGDSFECYIISDFDERDSIYDLGKYAIKVIPETVGQYTGITDKNGKKIFEDDIVKDEYERKETVKYLSGYYYPFIAFPEYKCMSESDCEVIGNIFEKGGKQ